MIANCRNCGTPTPVARMLREPRGGGWHCCDCPGEGWLRRVHGPRAAAALVALREGRPHPDFPRGLTLAALLARYGDYRPPLGGSTIAERILAILAGQPGLTCLDIDAILGRGGRRSGPALVRAHLHRLAARGAVEALPGRPPAPTRWQLAGGAR